MDIVLASRNKKKIEEMKRIIETSGIAGGEDVNIVTADTFPACGEVVEDGITFEANAVKKARVIAECSGLTAIADDSGLEVDALDGDPGVYSARYSGESADDRANLEKLLVELNDVPSEKRGARFVCCIAISLRGEVKTFTGYVEGIIAVKPCGDNGFGYDPVFYPEGHDRTFAEMSDDEKNSMSHRGRALEELQNYLTENRIELS